MQWGCDRLMGGGFGKKHPNWGGKFGMNHQLWRRMLQNFGKIFDFFKKNDYYEAVIDQYNLFDNCIVCRMIYLSYLIILTFYKKVFFDLDLRFQV